MAIPATIMIAKILLPETETIKTTNSALEEQTSGNLLDAISIGTCDGLQLALNVGAMLISFLALIAMINGILYFSCDIINSLIARVGLQFSIHCLSLQDIFGYIFAPFGWLLGLTGPDIFKAGQLIGIKVAINEMVAYSSLITMGLSERATALLTYALCGFSNFSCIGIQIGGIGALVPSKRHLISQLGFYAVLGGTLANLLSAFMAGLVL